MKNDILKIGEMMDYFGAAPSHADKEWFMRHSLFVSQKLGFKPFSHSVKDATVTHHFKLYRGS